MQRKKNTMAIIGSVTTDREIAYYVSVTHVSTVIAYRVRKRMQNIELDLFSDLI